MSWNQPSTAAMLLRFITTRSGQLTYLQEASAAGSKLERLERMLSGLAFFWVLIIGVQTRQVPTHVVESLPLLALTLAPRTVWVRVTAIVAGFSWLYMLVAVTPEFRNAILEWQIAAFTCWLAPTMVAICLAWMAVNLTILRGKAATFLGQLVGCTVLILPLWFLNHFCMERLLFPLQQIVAGQYIWALALMTSSFATVTCVIFVTKRITGAPVQWTRRTALGNLAFWTFFVSCMIVSQLPGIKHY